MLLTAACQRRTLHAGQAVTGDGGMGLAGFHPATRPKSVERGRGMRCGRTAYTLIELLVVIAIILVLAGVGVAWLADAKRSTKRVECANNMRQIGMCIIAEALRPERLPHKGLEEYPYFSSQRL